MMILLMHIQIISKETAKSLQMKRFFTGTPCQKGGISERFVSSGSCQCSLCVIPSKRNEKARLNYHLSEKKIQKRILTPEQQEKKNANTRAWKLRNAEKVKQDKRDYHKRNPHVSRAKRALRRATLKNRTPLWFGEFDNFVMNEAAHLCEIRKAATGFDWQVDHMFPLQAEKVSGLHCGINMQVIPRFLNTSKSNQMIFTEPFEWLKYF